MLNRSKHSLLIKKLDCEEGIIELVPGERIPFSWNNLDSLTKKGNLQDDKSQRYTNFCLVIITEFFLFTNRPYITIKLINNSPENGLQYYEWSGGLDISNLGHNYILLANKDHSKIKFYKVTISLDSHIMFVIFEEQALETASLKIRNKCQVINLLVYQACLEKKNPFIIPANKTMPFAWTYPLEARELIVDLYCDDIFYYHSKKEKYGFDDINHTTSFPVYIEAETIQIFSRVSVEDNSRILTFYDYDPSLSNIITDNNLKGKREKKIEEKVSLEAIIKLNGIGFSFISTLASNKSKTTRSEIIFMLLKWVDLSIINSNIQKSNHIRVKYFNIDNNVNFVSTYPVLMTPCKPKALLNKDKKKYFLDILIIEKTHEDNTFALYKSINVLMDAINIHIDGTFLDAILEVSKKLSSLDNANMEDSDNLTIEQLLFVKNPRAYRLVNNNYFDSKVEWKNLKLYVASENTHIEELIIFPIDIQLTFELGQSKGSNSSFLYNTLGSTLANIDNAHIRITGIKLNNIYDSSDNIKTKILNKYQQEAVGIVCGLLGSIDILGNPLGLVENITTGINDLYEKPIEGFLNGPTEGFIGLGEGARSLLQNMITGTFNSVSKITGAVSNGISAIPLDDEYQLERDILKMEKSKDVGDGIIKAAKVLWFGFEEGFTGLFLKPIQGAQEDGFTGFLKGTYSGITGVICKPVSGILDAASKTTEGIKSSTSYQEEKANEFRSRWPRPFYKLEKNFRIYHPTEAEIYYKMILWENGKYQNNHFIYACDIYPNPKIKDHDYMNCGNIDTDSKTNHNQYIFGLYMEGICLWNLSNQNLEWWINLVDIKQFIAITQGKNERLEVHMKPSGHKYDLGTIVIIDSFDKKINRLLATIVNEILKNMNDFLSN